MPNKLLQEESYPQAREENLPSELLQFISCLRVLLIKEKEMVL
jgi:hypothetical protein